MPIPSFLDRLFSDGCYSVPSSSHLRFFSKGKTCPPSELTRARLQQTLIEVRQTLATPTTRQGRALLMDVDRALDTLAHPSPEPAAWRKLPSTTDVEHWLDAARHDPRIRPDVLDVLHKRTRDLRSELSTRGVPSDHPLHRAVGQLIADVHKAGLPGPPIALKLSRALHERRGALDAQLMNYLCHRGALIQACLDVEPLTAGIRYLARLPPGVNAGTVRDLQCQRDQLVSSLRQAGRQLVHCDEPGFRTTVAGLAKPRIELRQRIDALGGACDTRHHPRLSPGWWGLPRPTPSPAPD